MLRELMEKTSSVDLSFYDTFDKSASFLLDKAVVEDMRIFIVISDQARARNTLCEVHTYYY